MSVGRIAAAVLTGLVCAFTPRASHASMQATVDYRILSTRGHGKSVVLLEQYGGDIGGTFLCTLSARHDSVVWREGKQWRAADDRRLGTELAGYWAAWSPTPATTSRLHISALGCDVLAPDSVGTDVDPFSFRPPVIRGATASCIYHRGRGRYVNYALRDAVWIPALRWLVVITNSWWQYEKVSYHEGVDLGDGIVVFRVSSPPVGSRLTAPWGKPR